MAQNGGGGDRRKRSVNMTIMAAEKGDAFGARKHRRPLPAPQRASQTSAEEKHRQRQGNPGEEARPGPGRLPPHPPRSLGAARTHTSPTSEGWRRLQGTWESALESEASVGNGGGGGGKLREADPLGHWRGGVVRGRGDAGGIQGAGEQPGGRGLEGLGRECGFHPECTEGSHWRVFCKEVSWYDLR